MDICIRINQIKMSLEREKTQKPTNSSLLIIKRIWGQSIYVYIPVCISRAFESKSDQDQDYLEIPNRLTWQIKNDQAIEASSQ